MIENIRARTLLERDFSIGVHQSGISGRYPIPRNGLLLEIYGNGDFYDSSYNNFNGIGTNINYIDSLLGYNKNCANLNGTNAYALDTTDRTLLKGTGTHTMQINCILKGQPANNTAYYLFGKGYDYQVSGGGWGMVLTTTTLAGVWTFECMVVTKVPSTVVYTAKGFTPQIDTPYCIIGEYDSTLQKVRLFINGVLIQETSTGNTLRNNGRWIMGAFKSDTGNIFGYTNGHISVGRIYNRLLSSKEKLILQKEGQKLLH